MGCCRMLWTGLSCVCFRWWGFADSRAALHHVSKAGSGVTSAFVCWTKGLWLNCHHDQCPMGRGPCSIPLASGHLAADWRWDVTRHLGWGTEFPPKKLPRKISICSALQSYGTQLSWPLSLQKGRPGGKAVCAGRLGNRSWNWEVPGKSKFSVTEGQAIGYCPSATVTSPACGREMSQAPVPVGSTDQRPSLSWWRTISPTARWTSSTQSRLNPLLPLIAF